MSQTISGKVYGLIDTVLNKKYIANLENQGAKVFRFPKCGIERQINEEAIKKSVQNLSDYDWILFADIYAADLFLEIMTECGVDPFELDEMVICAFGDAVADRLRFVQVHSDVIPPERSEQIIFETIKNYVADLDELKNLRVLFLKRTDSYGEIASRLKNEVGELIEISIYQTKGISGIELVKLKTLLKGGVIDEFIFCSAEDVESALHIISPDTFSKVFKGIEVLGTDASTFQALREHDLKPRLV